MQNRKRLQCNHDEWGYADQVLLPPTHCDRARQNLDDWSRFNHYGRLPKLI